MESFAAVSSAAHPSFRTSPSPVALALATRPGVDIAVWTRSIPPPVGALLARWAPSAPAAVDRTLRLCDGDAPGRYTVSPCPVEAVLAAVPGDVGGWLRDDVTRLLRRFAALACVAEARVFFGVIHDDQCSKLHVDAVRLRLVTTYVGPGTEWVPSEAVDRGALALRNPLPGGGERRDRPGRERHPPRGGRPRPRPQGIAPRERRGPRSGASITPDRAPRRAARRARRHRRGGAVAVSAALPLFLGFGLGLRHATDADHLAAIGTLLDREPTPRRAARLAAVWGLGHSLTFLGLGLIVVLFGVRVPPSFERATEGAVAAMLIGLGALTLVRVRRGRAGGGTTWRPLLVGVTHGLAGSAGIAIVALTAVPTTAGAIGYLAFFGAGTVLGMMTLTALIAFPMRWSVRRRGDVPRIVVTLAALGSIALGVGLAAAALFGAR